MEFQRIFIKENKNARLINEYCKSFKGIDNILKGIETFSFNNQMKNINVKMSIENENHNDKNRYADCRYCSFHFINGVELENALRTICKQFVDKIINEIKYNKDICSVSSTINVRQYNGTIGRDKNNGKITLLIRILEPKDRYFHTISEYIINFEFSEVCDNINIF